MCVCVCVYGLFPRFSVSVRPWVFSQPFSQIQKGPHNHFDALEGREMTAERFNIRREKGRRKKIAWKSEKSWMVRQEEGETLQHFRIALVLPLIKMVMVGIFTVVLLLLLLRLLCWLLAASTISTVAFSLTNTQTQTHRFINIIHVGLRAPRTGTRRVIQSSFTYPLLWARSQLPSP